MRGSSPILVVLLLLLSGCGYQWVNGRSGGPTPEIRLGEIVDGTPWGDLGLRARDRLRTELQSRARPALVNRPRAPVVRGRLSTPDAVAAGFDGNIHQTATESTLVLALRLEKPGGGILWHSGPIRRSIPWNRGPTVNDSVAARRLASEIAVDAAIVEGVRRLLAAPSREVL